ncbi:MAG TPA: hypothetical protein VMM78_04075, partial [Thermomicrobiales bacterium]|nr:hypothetical protein [Thermomicrobiales bacterium]
MVKMLTHVGAGAALAVATGVGAWLYILAAGRPFGSWSWTALTFCLLLVVTLALTTLAAVSTPFEPRLARWRFIGDPIGHGATNPLAIGYQLDHAASESNPPRRVTGETRWLWVAAPPFIATLALGVTLATSDDTPTTPGIILDTDAVAIARQALDESATATHRQLLGTQISTAKDTALRLENAVAFEVIHPERLVYAVYFGAAGTVTDPAHIQTVPGPVV